MPTGEYPLDGWRRVIDVNLTGVFYGMRYEIPAMKERGRGAIVDVASLLGSVAFATASAHVAAKHGVLGLTDTAALEHADDKIRVDSVGPGFIKTPSIDASLDEDTQAMPADEHALGRLGGPYEVAALIALLASDDAASITGSRHLVDGGCTAQQPRPATNATGRSCGIGRSSVGGEGGAWRRRSLRRAARAARA